MHEYMYVYACMYVCMYVSICMYVCMYLGFAEWLVEVDGLCESDGVGDGGLHQVFHAGEADRLQHLHLVRVTRPFMYVCMYVCMYV